MDIYVFLLKIQISLISDFLTDSISSILIWKLIHAESLDCVGGVNAYNFRKQAGSHVSRRNSSSESLRILKRFDCSSTTRRLSHYSFICNSRKRRESWCSESLSYAVCCKPVRGKCQAVMDVSFFSVVSCFYYINFRPKILSMKDNFTSFSSVRQLTGFGAFNFKKDRMISPGLGHWQLQGHLFGTNVWTRKWHGFNVSAWPTLLAWTRPKNVSDPSFRLSSFFFWC